MSWPGPEQLGRGVVLHRGQPVPDVWRSAVVVPVGLATLSDAATAERTIDTLHRAWVGRTPVVVEWDGPDDLLAGDESLDLPPWQLGARFSFPRERLRFLCFSNNYDARGGEPRWWWTSKARHLGVSAGGPADGALPDGAHVWIDGGPRQPLPPLDYPVIHGETVDIGGRLPVPPPPDSTPDGLAADQAAAVVHLAGPARIIAPAGSGKTRTLTARLRRLLDGHGVDPRHVVALAYNDRAAAEMRDRLGVGRDLARTIHSLGWEILREARPGLDLIDERQVREMLDRMLSLPRRGNTDALAPFLEALAQVRSRLRDPAEVEASRDDVAGFSEVFEEFRRQMYARGGVDHGEQVYGAIEALVSDAALRRRWQRRCRHLLVDEFQDLTPAYLLLIRLVATPELDVFGVGDDDQVIYGYDGADPGFLIDFDELFPGAAHHALQVNYRCSSDVVTAAVHLLGYNRRRIDKTITAAKPVEAERSFEVIAGSGNDLAVACAERVSQWIEAGERPEDIAVLTRVNSSLIPVKAALVDAGVPTNDLVTASSLQRSAVSALFAWMRLAADPDQMRRRDLLEAVKRPGRGLTRLARELMPMRPVSLDQLSGVGSSLSGRQAQRWKEFVADIAAAESAGRGGNAGSLISMLIDRVGLADSARALDSGRGNAAKSAHLDDLVAVRRAAAVHPSLDDFAGWLRMSLDQPSTPDGTTLSSVHRVKGMEWRKVVVLGVDRGSFPHELADDVEEERRVLHVAVTRSVTETLVFNDASRPSRFITELDGSAPLTAAEPPETKPSRPAPSRRTRKLGARVGDTVRIWGGIIGEVVSLADGAATVRLESGAEMDAGPGDIVEVVATAAPDVDERIADALREWRRDAAMQRNVPAYVVFNDRTLEELAGQRPATEDELLSISGIGPAKLEAYGDEILAIISDLATA